MGTVLLFVGIAISVDSLLNLELLYMYVALQDVIGLHISSENHGHPLNETLFYITLLVKLLLWTHL